MRPLLFSAILSILIFTNVFAYSGGTGEPNNPYQIADTNDLLALAADTNDYSKCFILTADVNLQGQVFTKAIIAPNTGSSSDWPPDFLGTAFTGTFDGNGHKVTGFTINGDSNSFFLGFFGCIKSSGLIKNLGLEHFTVTGFNSYVVGNGSHSYTFYIAGLVGCADGGSIVNCYSTGDVNYCLQFGYSGGITALNYGGNIIGCHSTGNISGRGTIGGLAGTNEYGGHINNCYSSGSVSIGEDYVGGLVGINNALIRNCYSTATVVAGTVEDTGGLVGVNCDQISNCFSKGPVSGYDCWSFGGLVGHNWGGFIDNCYSTSDIGYGAFITAGLVGENDGDISNCYSTGSAWRGLVAHNDYGTVSVSFWDKQTSGSTFSDGGTGKTTAEMKTLSTFTSAGWNFTTVWMMLRADEDYPRLAWQAVIVGDIAGLYGVNMVDYARFAAHWGQTGCPTDCENADINGDGEVNILDLSLLADHWLEGE